MARQSISRSWMDQGHRPSSAQEPSHEPPEGRDGKNDVIQDL